MKQLFPILMFAFAGWLNAMSQNADPALQLYDQLVLELPPVDELVDLAIANSPEMKFRDTRLELERLQLNHTKKQWMEKIATDIGYSYANNAVNYYAQSLDDYNEIASLNTRDHYRIGATVRISLLDIFGYKEQKGISQQEYLAAEYNRQNYQQQLELRIRKLYKDLLSAWELVKIQSQAKETYTVHMQMAQRQFLEGEIPVSELSRVTELLTRTTAAFEEAKNQFDKYYMELELLTGVDLKHYQKQ